MAFPLTPKSLDPANFEDEEDLSHEQMTALLQRAEKRLKAAVTSVGGNEDVLQLHDPLLVGDLDTSVDVRPASTCR